MKESEIRNMSLNERLRPMEILRNTLSAEDEIIESPNWHEEVLSKRKTKIDNGQANFITIDQLKQYYTHWISTSGYDRHGRWKCW